MRRYVDDVISRIGRMFPDMSIELFRPNGTSAVLLVRKHFSLPAVCRPAGGSGSDLSPSQVTLGKVLKAIVVMRSLFIDRTVVRGYNENVYNEDGKVGAWLTCQANIDSPTVSVLNYLSSTAGHLDQVSVPGVSEGKTVRPHVRCPPGPSLEDLIHFLVLR